MFGGVPVYCRNDPASRSYSVRGPRSTTLAHLHLYGTCARLMVMLGLAVTRSLRECPTDKQQQCQLNVLAGVHTGFSVQDTCALLMVMLGLAVKCRLRDCPTDK